MYHCFMSFTHNFYAAIAALADGAGTGIGSAF